MLVLKYELNLICFLENKKIDKKTEKEIKMSDFKPKHGDIVFYAPKVHDMIYQFQGEVHGHPFVKWGVLNYLDEYGLYIIDRYRLYNHPTIDGKPVDEIEGDIDDWHNIPKCHRKEYVDYARQQLGERVKYNYHINVNDLSKDDIYNAKELIKSGELRSEKECNVRFDFEFNVERNADKYRIIRQYPYKGGWDSTHKVFQTYEEASSEAKALFDDYLKFIKKSDEIKFQEDVCYICNLIPSKYESLRPYLLALPHQHGFCFRYYQGEILYKDRDEGDFTVVFKVEK